jgi:hypothetical protein
LTVDNTRAYDPVPLAVVCGEHSDLGEAQPTDIEPTLTPGVTGPKSLYVSLPDEA